MPAESPTPTDLAAAASVLRRAAENYGMVAKYCDRWDDTFTGAPRYRASAASLSRVADWLETMGWRDIASAPKDRVIDLLSHFGGEPLPTFGWWTEVIGMWTNWPMTCFPATAWREPSYRTGLEVALIIANGLDCSAEEFPLRIRVREALQKAVADILPTAPAQAEANDE